MKEELKNNVTEGTFMWTVEMMKQGKKVRRKCWIGKDIHVLDRFGIHTFVGTDRQFIYEDFEATDWEIYVENRESQHLEEPRKTLWDKYADNGCGRTYEEEDVKEALQEFLKATRRVYEIHAGETLMLDKAKEIFGERLVE